MPDTANGTPALIARCGLYCGECGAYKRGRCPGCAENAKAAWCKVRSCCLAESRDSCADCGEHPDPRTCGKFSNWIARLFGFVFRSDRAACIGRIREVGREEFAREMTDTKRQTIKRQ